MAAAFRSPGEPVFFAGEDAVAVTAIAAPSRDFNVMTARGRVSAEVSVRAGPFDAPGAGCVFVVAGDWRAGGDVHSLGPGDLLAMEPGDDVTRVDGEGCAIRIALAPP
jgi:environmental stress-induced protein Ves